MSMMINKRLINTVKESKKYIVGNVICQWISLTANITMMGAIAGMLQGLFDGSTGEAQIVLTALIAAVAVVVRFACATTASRMGYLSSKAVKKTLREMIYKKLLGVPIMKKILYMILGCVGVGLGAVGAVIPMLPAFPFLMLATFCFARSSEKLDRWFKNTKLYKDNLEDFVAGRGMTMKAKVRIMVTVTLLMSVGFIMMGLKGIVTGCVVLGCVWVFHIVYFLFGIKTIPVVEASAA